MQGFDSKFKDFPDYIIGITREIWENRGIATLHHYYSDDIVVRSPGSVVVGNVDVIGATMATLAEFPTGGCWARTSFGLAAPKRACSARTGYSQPRPTLTTASMVKLPASNCATASSPTATRSTIRSTTRADPRSGRDHPATGMGGQNLRSRPDRARRRPRSRRTSAVARDRYRRPLQGPGQR